MYRCVLGVLKTSLESNLEIIQKFNYYQEQKWLKYFSIEEKRYLIDVKHKLNW